MQDVNRHAAEFDNFGLGEPPGPAAFVDVAANGSEGCNCCQFFENFGIADIPGVNDVVRAAQRSDRFRTKQPVRVGDDADENGSPQLFRFLPINWFISA